MTSDHPAPRLGRRELLALGAAAAVVAPRAAAARAYAGDTLVGAIVDYVVSGEETLLEVARRYNLGVPEISAANPGVDPWVPGQGTRLTLPTAHLLPDGPREGILVNTGELRLYWFTPDGGVETYSIGVGQDELATPLGQTRVVRKQSRPTWRPTPEARVAKPYLPAVVPPGPENPMGEHALYLGWPTYAIHGTNRPYAVGRRVSRGCIRLYPEGVARLYEKVATGTRVTVVDQPIKIVRHAGEVWLQAKPTLEQIDELEASYRLRPKPVAFGDLRSLIVARAGIDAPRIDWPLVEREVRERRGVPVPITARDASLVAGTRPPITDRGRPFSAFDGIY